LAGGIQIRKILVRIVGIVIAVALLVLLAASLIIARPADEEQAPVPVKPSAKASPAVTAESEKDLPEVIASFPAPVMNFMSGSGMTFVSASSADAALNGGFGRIATLNWQTPEGEPVMLRSIWPADALSLLEAGYHFMPYAGPTLFGNASVRMENDDAVRIHTATDRALYVVLLPRSLSGQAGTLCRSLQLFTVGE
jgi:hypothetical protein